MTASFPPTCSPRMVKKLKPCWTVEFTTHPSLKLRLAYCPLHHAYSTPIEGGTSGRGKAYGLEDIVGIYHRISRPRTPPAQRVTGDGKPHPPEPDHGAHPVERR